MAETAEEKAHRDKFRLAFCDAVLHFDYWNRGGPEPRITIEGATDSNTIGQICNVVGFLSGDLPDHIFQIMRRIAADFNISLGDRSYRVCAGCLVQAYAARKARYEAKGI